MGLHGRVVELVEARGGMVAGEVHGRLALVLDDDATRLSATSAGESIGRISSQTLARSAPSPTGRASRNLRATRSDPSVLMRVTPSGSSVNPAPSREVSCVIPRSGSGSSSARWSSASTIASGWRGS